MMFVWKDKCGESVHIIVVWCDLSVWYISWQKKERMREMYARTIDSEHGDEKSCDREDAQTREMRSKSELIREWIYES